MELTLYQLDQVPPFPFEPADMKRAWLDGDRRFAAARQPGLARANQAGWVIRCPIDIRFTWNGRHEAHQGLTAYSKDPERERYAGFFQNAFGHGILTIGLPFLFRTPPGIGLLVRGPTNFHVENLHPLDGLVESDWLESTFTMNWRILRPNVTTGFAKGDPVCMVQPYPLDLLESVAPQLMPAASGAPPAGAVERLGAGSWRHVIPDAPPGLDPADQPGKPRLRLKKV